jgi:type VI secretion system secreted protein VgrG
LRGLGVLRKVGCIAVKLHCYTAEELPMNIEIASADFIQAERILRVETPLGPDVLLPERMEIVEKISGLFELSIAVRSKRGDLSADELVGKLVDVSLETGMGLRRTWNGLVIGLSQGPAVTRGLRAYHLTIVPQHWLLSQKSDCRIWLDKTSVEVAQILMGEHGLLSPVTSGVIEPPKPQHYSVQFNETDLAYLTRRLEEDGLFYWFEHEGGAPGSVSATHTLHIAAHQAGYSDGPDPDVRFAMGSSDRNHISKFEKTFRFVPGKRAGTDWNFLTPSGVPEGDTPSLVKLPKNDQYELYEYPLIGGYGTGSASEGIDNALVKQQSKLRMMAAEADHERIEGKSDVRTLSPGRRFKPYDVANPSNTFEEHVIYEIKHTARDRSYETNEGEPEYANTFTAIPSRVPSTPHRTTKRPRIDGTQVALVAGPAGEEIHPDEYGRIKLWFPWDRRAKKDGSDTCWVRVTQNWAGAGWGGQIIPRIGMEVMVTYLDGDPDRPVVTGVVPNPRQKVPYKLPENKTKSVFRTNTHKSKNWKRMNELTFEDEAGREEIYMHAQKDQCIHVENNRSKRIDQSQSESVGKHKTIDVGRHHKETIGGNMRVVIGVTNIPNFGEQLLSSVMGPVAFKDQYVSKKPYEAAALMDADQTKGNYELFVSANKTEKIAQSATEKIGMAKISSVYGFRQDYTEGTHTSHIDQNKILQVGTSYWVNAGSDIMIQSGESVITMLSDGTIKLHGDKILIEGKTSIKLKSKKIELN